METNETNFFTIVPLGTEDLALEELKEKLTLLYSYKLQDVKVTRGGLEYTLPLSYGLEISAYLKIATRQLLRIESFKARDLPKLYKKLLKINWSKYLRGQIPEIKSTSSKSRILDDRKVIKTTTDALSEFFKRQAPKKAYLESIPDLPKSTLYLRFVDDICTVSLDVCGERLDQRGYKLLSSKAPLRESLAAAMIYQVLKEEEITTLQDPMCGSASFGLEAAGFYLKSLNRDFYFRYIPCYKESLNKLPNSLKEINIKKYLASDIDEKTIKSAIENFKASEFKNLEYSFSETDIFENKGTRVLQKSCAVIINPPYGKRIKLDKPIKQYYKELLSSIKTQIHPKYIVSISPSNQFPKNLTDYKIKKKMKWSNGGIDVDFIMYQHQDPC